MGCMHMADWIHRGWWHMGCTHIGFIIESVVSDLSHEKKCTNASHVTAPCPASNALQSTTDTMRHVQSCLELPQVFEKQWFEWSTFHKAVASPFECKGMTDLQCRFCWRHHQSFHGDHPSLLPVTVAWMQQSGHGTGFQCLNLMGFLAFQHNASFVLLRLKECLSSSYKMMYSRKLSFEHHACLGSKEDSNGGPTSLSCFMAAISCCLLIVLRLQPIVQLLVFTWA